MWVHLPPYCHICYTYSLPHEHNSEQEAASVIGRKDILISHQDLTFFFCNERSGLWIKNLCDRGRVKSVIWLFTLLFNPGRILNKVWYGEAPPPGATPYPFIHHFGRKGTSFIYLLSKKGTFTNLLKSTAPPF